MYLSRIMLVCILLSFSFPTPNSHRRYRTFKMERPRFYDDYDGMVVDYEIPDYIYARRGGQARSPPTQRYAICSETAFFYSFTVSWDRLIQRPAAYGINLRCETEKITGVIGNYDVVDQISPVYRTGRVNKIRYWRVDDRIYKIEMYGKQRVGVWETSSWAGGERTQHLIQCLNGQYAYGLLANLKGIEGKADYMYNLQIYCRSENPGGK